ncbi:sensor histidine kinase [Microvirga arabica]|uniref:histidine kinase n=1 Tax=Microvirga arabica TaxID=1128671 RepID=A0ABV6Y2D3_9HYPH|nr:MEDS domain-containing protein [Microvirga arabica]MBM1174325.1 MEDS domain-containing protein [Microvirga arabica]
MTRTPSGIQAVGDLPWGTHFCQFYEDRSDLADALVPYFKKGLENNEKCLWVTSEPFGREDARASLRAAVPDLDQREARGQIEIIDFQNWYLRAGNLDADETVSQWLGRAHAAVGEGYSGLRLTGNTFWLECDGFDEFADYENKVNREFSSQPILALCSYCLDRCRPTDVLEVVRNHQFALTRRRGSWEVIEDASLKQARSELESLNSELERRVLDRTNALERALHDKNELFREVHHRVRNNLQIISSLVRMKLRQTRSEDIKEGYTDILGRVDAIALVHDALYASDELTKVPVSNYLKKLCDSLVQLRGREDRIFIRLEAEDADIGLDKAVTLGLITTELVTNALKHAFPHGRRGEILVRFGCKSRKCTLVVSDDGVGLASKQSDRQSRSGLRLVASLALQLGAELRETSEPGTTIHLQFPQS